MGTSPGTLLGGISGDLLGSRATLAIGAGLMCLSIPVVATRRIFALTDLPERAVGTPAAAGEVAL